MFIECPHCFRRVLPLANGECPACHRDTRDTRGIDPNKTRILVNEQSQFPDVCCTCAVPTKNNIKITRSGQVVTARDPRESAKGPADYSTLFLFGGVIGLLARLCFGGRDKETNPGAAMKIEIPQCEECAAKTPIEPDLVDLERFQMGLIVHKHFADQLKRS